MAKFKFDAFVFDTSNYNLTRNGKKLTLRPKALSLMKFLLENRDRVVSKAEIFEMIWGTGHERDHLLFQLVSELRKPPLNKQFIRTVPNAGYQWNVRTQAVQKRAAFSIQIAASLLLGIACVLGMLDQVSQDKDTNNFARLPAYSALSKGVVALEEGDSLQAEQWFKFVLNENPNSVESSLFLAEALIRQNKFDQSSERLRALLVKRDLAPYNKLSVTNMLSHIQEQQGDVLGALGYAKQSRFVGELPQCSAGYAKQRLERLRVQSGTVGVGSSDEEESAVASSKLDILDEGEYVDKCDKLNELLDQTSQCKPLINDVFVVDVKMYDELLMV